MTILEAIIRKKTDTALSLLDNLEIRAHAHEDNNLLLRLAQLMRQDDVVKKLQEIKAVRRGIRNGVHHQPNCALELYYHCIYGYPSIARSKLKEPAMNAEAHANDNLALCLAALHGETKLVKKLLKIEAVRQNAHASKNLALRLAADHGHEDIMVLLLETSEKVRNLATAEDNEAFRWALRGGCKKAASMLFKLPTVQEDLQKPNEGNRHILHLALNRNLEESLALELLEIDHVRENSAKNQDLWLAASVGFLGVVRKLLQQQAVRHENLVAPIGGLKQENLPLRMAVDQDHTEIALEFLSNEEVKEKADAGNNEILIHAAKNGNLVLVRKLLEIPCVRKNVVARNFEAVWIAACYGHFDVVQELLKTDAVQEMLQLSEVPEHLAMVVQSLLIYALETDNARLVIQLLQYPAIQHQAVSRESRALWLAAKKGFLEVVQHLLKNKMVYETAAQEKICPPHYIAICKEHEEVALCLLNVKPVQQDLKEFGYMSLQKAAELGLVRVVARLLEFKPIHEDVEKVLVALKYAVNEERGEVVRLLLGHPGVKKKLEDSKVNEEFIENAIQKGHAAALRELLNNPDCRKKIESNLEHLLIVATQLRHHSVVAELLKCDRLPEIVLKNQKEGNDNVVLVLLRQAIGWGDIATAFELIKACEALQQKTGQPIDFFSEMQLALYRDRPQVVLELLKRKTLHQRTSLLEKLLKAASEKGHADVVAAILEISSIEQHIDDVKFHMELAVKNGHMEVVRAFLRNKSIRSDLRFLKKMFIIAAKSGSQSEAIALELLSLKEIQDVAHDDDNCCVVYAARQGHCHLLKALLQLERVRNNSLMPALLNAITNDRVDAVRELLSIKKVRESIAEKNHKTLEAAAKKGNLVILQLIIDIYADQKIPLPIPALSIPNGDAVLPGQVTKDHEDINRLLQKFWVCSKGNTGHLIKVLPTLNAGVKVPQEILGSMLGNLALEYAELPSLQPPFHAEIQEMRMNAEKIIQVCRDAEKEAMDLEGMMGHRRKLQAETLNKKNEVKEKESKQGKEEYKETFIQNELAEMAKILKKLRMIAEESEKLMQTFGEMPTLKDAYAALRRNLMTSNALKRKLSLHGVRIGFLQIQGAFNEVDVLMQHAKIMVKDKGKLDTIGRMHRDADIILNRAAKVLKEMNAEENPAQFYPSIDKWFKGLLSLYNQIKLELYPVMQDQAHQHLFATVQSLYRDRHLCNQVLSNVCSDLKALREMVKSCDRYFDKGLRPVTLVISNSETKMSEVKGLVAKGIESQTQAQEKKSTHETRDWVEWSKAQVEIVDQYLSKILSIKQSFNTLITKLEKGQSLKEEGLKGSEEIRMNLEAVMRDFDPMKDKMQTCIQELRVFRDRHIREEAQRAKVLKENKLGEEYWYSVRTLLARLYFLEKRLTEEGRSKVDAKEDLDQERDVSDEEIQEDFNELLSKTTKWMIENRDPRITLTTEVENSRTLYQLLQKLFGHSKPVFDHLVTAMNTQPGENPDGPKKGNESPRSLNTHW